jgi:membrane protein implicated in regulation of membrane protease activity
VDQLSALLPHPAIVWIIAAIVFAIIEVVLPAFGPIFCSAAALVAALCAGFGLRWEVQLAVFAVCLFGCLVLLRPRLAARLSGARGIPSRTEALLGKEGKVTEAIDPAIGAGRVVVEGQDWAAGPRDGRSAIASGTRVRVVGADGITLHVEALEQT